MITYIAGNEPGVSVYRYDWAAQNQLAQLWSYHHFLIAKNHEILTMGKEEGVKLFLDSGAFSAMTQKTEIDIEDYIAFVQKHEKSLHVYSNLDVIGDPQATWANQMIMEKRGLSPIPTFHYGSNIKWLKRLLKRYDYIALGGMVPIMTKNLIPWLDDLFQNYICNAEGIPQVKIHGFGMTSLKLMFRYPWWSVDSTSWIVTGKLGMIYVPQMTAGDYDYMKEPMKVTVSMRSPSQKERGKHLKSMSPLLRDHALRYIKEKGFPLGRSKIVVKSADHSLRDDEKWADKKSPATKRKVERIIEAGISNDYQMRDKINIQYFIDLEKNFPKWPWAFKLKTSKMGFDL